MIWDQSRRQLVVQAIDVFQKWTSSWSNQMDQFYEDWLDSMLLLESRSQFGTQLTDQEYEQLREAIERAQLHDLLKQHVEHVQSFLERSRENHPWTRGVTISDEVLEDFVVYPFVRSVDVLISIVTKSIDKMAAELELWQTVFTGWENTQEFYRAWPEMDLRFADMQAVLIDGRKKIAQLKMVIDMKQPNVDVHQRETFDQAVIQELEPLMKRLRSVYERQYAQQIVGEIELSVGSNEGEIILFDEPDTLVERANDYIYVKLADSLTIYAVKSEQRLILEQVSSVFEKQSGTVVVDGSNVLDIDASGIQLLLSLAKSCEQKGIAFRLESPSDVLVHWLQRSGTQMITA